MYWSCTNLPWLLSIKRAHFKTIINHTFACLRGSVKRIIQGNMMVQFYTSVLLNAATPRAGRRCLFGATEAVKQCWRLFYEIHRCATLKRWSRNPDLEGRRKIRFMERSSVCEMIIKAGSGVNLPATRTTRCFTSATWLGFIIIRWGQNMGLKRTRHPRVGSQRSEFTWDPCLEYVSRPPLSCGTNVLHLPFSLHTGCWAPHQRLWVGLTAGIRSRYACMPFERSNHGAVPTTHNRKSLFHICLSPNNSQ